MFITFPTDFHDYTYKAKVNGVALLIYSYLGSDALWGFEESIIVDARKLAIRLNMSISTVYRVLETLEKAELITLTDKSKYRVNDYTDVGYLNCLKGVR